MELLSKDLIGIIDRYLFDYCYSQVKQQYKDVWLNEFENTECKIYWNDKGCCFETLDYLRANWRDRIDNGSEICNFFDDFLYIVPSVYLPPNYM